MPIPHHRIDVHYHIIPKPYVQALEAKGITGSTFVKFPRWTPASAIKQLDRCRVATAVTSLSTPGVWFDDAPLARRLSRLCNEFQAAMAADHPGRFGSLAFLPLPDVDGALRELEYALDQLGHDGVVLLSDVAGQYLGHPAYEEVFAELDRRSATVFVHPHDDPRVKRRHDILSPLLEWPVHTTRAAIDLLYSGRLERYPNIRYILAHGGGALPYLAHRVAAGRNGSRSSKSGDQGSGSLGDGDLREELRLLRNLYFDTASPGEGHFAALKEFAAPGHILFGTDGGWTPPVQTSLAIKALLAFDGFTRHDLASIESESASTLFPRFGPETRPPGASDVSAETSAPSGDAASLRNDEPGGKDRPGGTARSCGRARPSRRGAPDACYTAMEKGRP